MFIQIYPYPKVSQSNHPRFPSFMSWSLPPYPRSPSFHPFQPGTRRPELDDSISAQGEDGDGQQLRHGRRTARPKKQLAADVLPVGEEMGKLGKIGWNLQKRLKFKKPVWGTTIYRRCVNIGVSRHGASQLIMNIHVQRDNQQFWTQQMFMGHNSSCFIKYTTKHHWPNVTLKKIMGNLLETRCLLNTLHESHVRVMDKSFMRPPGNIQDCNKPMVL